MLYVAVAVKCSGCVSFVSSTAAVHIHLWAKQSIVIVMTEGFLHAVTDETSPMSKLLC